MKFYSFYSFVRSPILGKSISLSKRENYERLVMRHRQRVNYSLPTFLVSFPRSGSNFLQSILEKSSGLLCRSIYSGLHNSPHDFLSLKSHAVSSAYLLDEIEQVLARVPKSLKLIILCRDPCDVMISYYEYTQMQKNIQINQGNFLNSSDYFLEAIIKRERFRRVKYKLLSVSQAYKQHVRSWFTEPLPEHLDCLVVKYENLVQEPQKEFQRIFNFFELKCSLAKQSLDEKVSLYSSEPRHRGQVYGWKNNVSRYRTLLKTVNSTLWDEITELGYH